MKAINNIASVFLAAILSFLPFQALAETYCWNTATREVRVGFSVSIGLSNTPEEENTALGYSLSAVISVEEEKEESAKSLVDVTGAVNMDEGITLERPHAFPDFSDSGKTGLDPQAPSSAENHTVLSGLEMLYNYT